MAFFTLQDDEQIIEIVRKHWWVILIKTLGILVITFLVNGLMTVLVDSGIFAIDGNPAALKLFTSTTIWFLAWLAFSITWVNYYLDIWVVTDKHIYDIEQKSFFFRDVSVFRLANIQDMTIEVNGIIATLINFGDLHVQTAAKSRDFKILSIPAPQRVKTAIAKAQQRAERDRYHRDG